jgi:hypothetical protein
MVYLLVFVVKIKVSADEFPLHESCTRKSRKTASERGILIRPQVFAENNVDFTGIFEALAGERCFFPLYKYTRGKIKVGVFLSGYQGCIGPNHTTRPQR